MLIDAVSARNLELVANRRDERVCAASSRAPWVLMSAVDPGSVFALPRTESHQDEAGRCVDNRPHANEDIEVVINASAHTRLGSARAPSDDPAAAERFVCSAASHDGVTMPALADLDTTRLRHDGVQGALRRRSRNCRAFTLARLQSFSVAR